MSIKVVETTYKFRKKSLCIELTIVHDISQFHTVALSNAINKELRRIKTHMNLRSHLRSVSSFSLSTASSAGSVTRKSFAASHCSIIFDATTLPPDAQQVNSVNTTSSFPWRNSDVFCVQFSVTDCPAYRHWPIANGTSPEGGSRWFSEEGSRETVGPRGGWTHENTKTGLLVPTHVPVDGSRRTAATFRFARFLFFSFFVPSSPGRSPSFESRGAGARTCRPRPRNSDRHLLFFALHPFSFPSSCPQPPLFSPLLRFSSPHVPASLLPAASSCSFAACLLWVFSLTAASAPLFFGPGRAQPWARLIDGGPRGGRTLFPLPTLSFHLLLSLERFLLSGWSTAEIRTG